MSDDPVHCSLECRKMVYRQSFDTRTGKVLSGNWTSTDGWPGIAFTDEDGFCPGCGTRLLPQRHHGGAGGRGDGIKGPAQMHHDSDWR